MNNYIEVAYKESDKPFGEYPLQLAKYLVDRFHMQPQMSLLDNGCGRGEFLHAFSKCGLITSGTDLSNYCQDAKIVNLETETLPFADEGFDVVFSKSVLEHIVNVEHYMAEMKRVLKKGGHLILMVPDWKTQYKIFYQDPTHIHPYTKESLEKLLLMQAFDDVSAEKFIQLPYVWNNKPLELTSKLLRLLPPPAKIYRNKFFRFSRELMILGHGIKGD